jgi:hypothetical protein
MRYYPGEPKEYTLRAVVDAINSNVGVYENERTLYKSSAVHDCNRIIHIDPQNGLDSSPGTLSQPKRTFVPGSWTNTIGAANNFQSGDLIAFKRGTTYIHSTGSPIDFGGSGRHMGSYGDPRLPRPILRSTHSDSAGVYVVGIGSVDNCSFSDLDIDASDSGNRTGLLISNGGREQDMYGITVQSCRITGVTCSVTGTPPNAGGTLRAGVRVQNNGYTADRASAYPTMYDIDIINVDVEGCGYHGFHTTGVTGKLIDGVLRGIRFRGCRAIDNGWQYDGHGFSSFAFGTKRTVSPTYTLASGTTFYFPVNVAAFYGVGIRVPDVEIVIQHTPDPIQTIWLRKNTATPTTPAVGEFGFDFATQRVYVNTGRSDVPTGAPNVDWWVDTCTYATKGITYDRCIATGTKWARQTGVGEGHGFAFDDLTSFNQVLNCESIDNEGLGVSFNRGRGNWLILSRVANNGTGAIGGSSMGHRIWGNWLDSSTTFNTAFGNGVINFTPFTYQFADEHIRIGGCRSLSYTGSDTSAFLVVGSGDQYASLVHLDNSVVDPGVARVSGYGSADGEGGFVLARGLLSTQDVDRVQLSTTFSGF